MKTPSSCPRRFTFHNAVAFCFRFVPSGLVGLNDPAAVPEQVEHCRGLSRDRADAQHIDIAEIEMAVQPHVLVTDIAPPDNRGAISNSLAKSQPRPSALRFLLLLKSRNEILGSIAVLRPHRVANAGANDLCVDAGTVAWCAGKVVVIVHSKASSPRLSNLNRDSGASARVVLRPLEIISIKMRPVKIAVDVDAEAQPAVISAKINRPRCNRAGD